MRNKRRRVGAQIGTAMVAALAIAPTAFAAEAIETIYENEVAWDADGTITATIHEAEAVGGVTGNYWPDAALHESIGQTFRCDGPILKAVQLGIADFDNGYRGLNVHGKAPAMTVRLRRSGPRGQIVASKTYPPDKIRKDLLLEVNQPTSSAEQWYLEVLPAGPVPEKTRLALNATWNDSYPYGAMHLNGRPTQGDLHMRIHRAYETASQRPGSVVLWAAPVQRRIWLEPDRNVGDMLRDGLAKPIALAAAGRESVSVQVVATPAPDYELRTATADVAAFHSSEGNTIDRSHVTIEHLRYLQNFKRGKTSEFLYPDPLAPANSASNAAYPPEHARSNQCFVVTVEVPAEQPAGVYRSQVTLTLADGQAISRPIELTVHGFSLSHETHTKTGLFKDLANKSIDEHLDLAADLASFRIAIGHPFHWDETQLLRRGNFSPNAYEQSLGQGMQDALVRTGEVLNSRGIELTSVVTPWADIYRLFRNQQPDEARQGIKRFWSVYYPLLEQHNLTHQVHARMIDEVDGDELLLTREIAALFREYAPDVKLMVTAIGTPDREMLERAIGIADIWCPSSRYFARALDFYRYRVEQGEEVWPYIHDHAFLATDSAGPLLFFWMLEKYGMQGATYFSIRRSKVTHTWFGLEQHTDTWAGDGDLYFAPPSESGQPLWRSIRLHLIRDGIEDREYFWLLNHLASQVRDAGQMTDALERQINEARSSIDTVVWGGTSFNSEPVVLDAARQKVVSAIEQLQATLE